MEAILIRALQLILSLSILVFFHELGHFFFSKIFKVRVEKFYLFFNPYFSIFRAKKINGKWSIRFFSKNLESLSTPTLDHKGNYIKDSKGNYLYNTTPIESLSDDDWRKYPASTEWGIGWLPLGGYCKIAGMVDESMDNAQMASEPKPWEYRSVSTWKRLPIIAGGVLVNFLMALLIYSAILFTWGEKYIPLKNYTQGFDFSETAKKYGFEDGDLILKADDVDLEQFNELELRKILDAKDILVLRNGIETNLPFAGDFKETLINSQDYFATPRLPFVVNEIIENSPASKAGLQKGDSLIAINDTAYTSFFNFAEKINLYKGATVNLGFYRSDSLLNINISPDSTGIIGVRPMSYSYFFEVKEVKYNLIQSIPAGVMLGVNKLKGYVSDLKYIRMDNIGGFASIGKLFDSSWNWQRFWEMTAFLSIILAFMNILPIPGLDGGHLIFLLYEIITGRKPNQSFLAYAQIIGMILLFALMIFANLNDFMK